MMRYGTLMTCVAALMGVTACWTAELDRGADENQQQSGWQDRGRNPGYHQVVNDPGTGEPTWEYVLQYQEVILTPDGDNLLVMVPIPGPNAGWDTPGMVLTMRSLTTSATIVFRDLVDVRRINFSPDGGIAYVLVDDGQTLVELDLQTAQTRTLTTFGSEYSKLDVSPDGRYVVASRVLDNDLLEWLAPNGRCGDLTDAWCRLSIWDTVERKAVDHDATELIRDLDFDRHGNMLLTSSTWDAQGQPLAHVWFVDPADGEFVTNLPGFGPVSMAADGSRAVGFTRRQDMADQWDYAQESAVGLIVVELPSLAWRVIDYGDFEPTYLLAGSAGSVIYAHHHEGNCTFDRLDRHCQSPSPLYRFDIATGERTIASPDARLYQFVARDADNLLLLDDGVLTYLDVAADTATAVAIPHRPELFNLTAQGDRLVFGHRDMPRFYVAPVNDPADVSGFEVEVLTRTPR